jgi:O-antigen ligase
MADELKYFYPITALINLGLALGISRFVFTAAKQSTVFLKSLSFHLVAGVVISIISGLLDYFDFLSLIGIRELDPQVNAGGIQFRLQSFFGHSGWYAEYLTFSMPFVISLMLLPVRNWLKIILCLGTMIIGEYALILTYQRGGWISYPLTLVGIWSAIHILKGKDRNNVTVFNSVFKRTFRRILISLPITIAISISLVKLYSTDSASTQIQKYTDRVAQIAQTQDRTEYFKAGANLGLMHPILGGGLESFGLQYVDEISKETGSLHKKYELPFHGSAHNFYFQVFSGTGLIGLICILYLIFSTIISIYSTLRNGSLIPSHKLALALITGSFLLAILIYGVVQEIFYIQCLQILFFSTLFGFAAEFPQTFAKKSKIRGICLSATLIAFVSHLIWEEKSGRVLQQEQRAFGCHPAETEENGWVFSWCGPTAYLPYKVKDGAIQIKVQSILESKESTMTIFEGRDKIGEFKLQPGTYYEKVIPIGRRTTETVWITIKNEAAFIPDLLYPESNDFRLLSFKLTPTLD